MKFFRSFLFVIYLYSAFLVLGIVFLPALLLPKSIIFYGMRSWARMAVWGMRVIVGATTEIRGREHIGSEPVVLTSKHQSMMDTLLPFLFLKAPCFILKKELMYYPIFGLYAWKAGMIAVDRQGSTKALKDMTRKAAAAIAEGRSLVIFPEGTRIHPDDETDLKPGIAFLYKEIDAPVIPVALNTGHAWPAKGIMRYSGHMVLNILPAMERQLPRKSFMKTLKSILDDATRALNSDENRQRQTTDRV